VAAPTAPARGRIARNTAIFSVATGLSRVAGLIREVVTAAFFGTSGAISAFGLAFLVPNLVRNLVADSALSAAFVPVFSELVERGRRREALQLATTFAVLITAVLGLVTVLFVLVAPALMPLLTGDEFSRALDELTVGLTQVMFPIVLLLGLNGLAVGILNAYDHFAVPALSPLVWNAVILAFVVAGWVLLDGEAELYAYAVGVVAGTAVQLAMCVPVLRRLGFRLEPRVHLRDPRVKQVLVLMLPVTLGLGLINFNQLIAATLATNISEGALRAIDYAFRLYMLPQGIFSVAVATVLFPALSRLAARRDLDGLRALTAAGLRQIALLLVPCAAATLVLAEPIVRLVYERGEFDAQSTDLTAEALFWFSLSLPFAGANLLLTRTFFSLRRPWLPTALGAMNLAVNAAVAFALYRPLGIAGIVLGIAVASAAMTLGQARLLARELGGDLEGARTLSALARMLLAAAALAGVAYALWWALDAALGRSLPAQLVAVGGALAAGVAAYAAAVAALRIPEADRVAALVRGRLGR
jgi:putative peptidoglycan lipid II flippase